MFRFSVPSLIKFLVGNLLLQAVTLLLAYTALQTDIAETWWLFVAIGLAIGTLVALWFTSLAEGHRHKAESHLKERHFREREAIRTKLEKEKAQAIRSTERQAAKEKKRASTSNMMKTGGLVAAGVGAVLVLTQFVTVGLLTITTAGGLLLGYGVRSRQDRWTRQRLGAKEGDAVGALNVSEKPAILSPAKRLKGPSGAAKRRPKKKQDEDEDEILVDGSS